MKSKPVQKLVLLSLIVIALLYSFNSSAGVTTCEVNILEIE